MPDRDIYIFTKLPPEQNSSSEIKSKEIGEKIKPLREYINAIKVFDEISGSSNSKYIDQFFIREIKFYIFFIYHNHFLFEEKNNTK